MFCCKDDDDAVAAVDVVVDGVDAVVDVVVVAVDFVVFVVVAAADVAVVDIAYADCPICKRERKQRQTNPNNSPCTGVGCIHMETDIDRNIPATA